MPSRKQLLARTKAKQDGGPDVIALALATAMEMMINLKVARRHRPARGAARFYLAIVEGLANFAASIGTFTLTWLNS